MRKALKVVVVVLLVLLVLQTAVLCVFAIQFSDSKLFRLTTGFLGIGLIITPLVLRTLGSIAVDVSTRQQWTGIIYLSYLLAGPWVHLPLQGRIILIEYFNRYAVASASVQLASASAGFFITGIIAGLKSGPDASTGEVPGPLVKILRVLLSLGLLLYASYNFLPVVCRLLPGVLVYNPFSMAADSYGMLVATSSGDPVIWLANMMLSAVVYYKFYSDWILKDKI